MAHPLGLGQMAGRLADATRQQPAPAPDLAGQRLAADFQTRLKKLGHAAGHLLDRFSRHPCPPATKPSEARAAPQLLGFRRGAG